MNKEGHFNQLVSFPARRSDRYRTSTGRVISIFVVSVSLLRIILEFRP